MYSKQRHDGWSGNAKDTLELAPGYPSPIKCALKTEILTQNIDNKGLDDA